MTIWVPWVCPCSTTSLVEPVAGVTSNAMAGQTNFQVTAGNVPSPAGCTITINVTSTVAGTHNNQASGAAHSTDAVPGAPSNIATLVVLAAPLVSKSFLLP